VTADTLADIATISGIASSPAVDSYGHSVRVGAFDASIRARGLSGPQSIKLLEGHQGLPIGRITSLRTVGRDLRIEAELNMELARVRDLHSVIKHSGGLNFSVGFRLEEFDLVDKPGPNDPYLIVKRGDLHEVSVVTFPACADAQMDMALSRFAPSPFDALLAKAKRVRAAAEELQLSWRRESAHDALMAQLNKTRAAADNLRRAMHG
jgi:HK97 family phage prohead protease